MKKLFKNVYLFTRISFLSVLLFTAMFLTSLAICEDITYSYLFVILTALSIMFYIHGTLTQVKINLLSEGFPVVFPIEGCKKSRKSSIMYDGFTYTLVRIENDVFGDSIIYVNNENPNYIIRSGYLGLTKQLFYNDYPEFVKIVSKQTINLNPKIEENATV